MNAPVGRGDCGRGIADRRVDLSAFLDGSVTSSIDGALMGTRTEHEDTCEGKGAESNTSSFTVVLAVEPLFSCRRKQSLAELASARASMSES